jgi:N-acetylglucosamine-6-phosphate deacetylase
MVTHLFNAMSGIHHRDFGMVLAALTDDRVLTGLIADMHHVNPEAVALAFSAKPTGVCLVSDSIAWRASWAVRAGVRLVGGVPTLGDGTLAGSATPSWRAGWNFPQLCVPPHPFPHRSSTGTTSATSAPVSHATSLPVTGP